MDTSLKSSARVAYFLHVVRLSVNKENIMILNRARCAVVGLLDIKNEKNENMQKVTSMALNKEYICTSPPMNRIMKMSYR